MAPTEPDEKLALTARHVQSLIADANHSLREAAASDNIDMRQAHERYAFTCVVEAEVLCIAEPRISITSLDEFKRDLDSVHLETRRMLMESRHPRR